METAEKQVTDVVKVDIHLDYTPDGKRFIHRISEIIQLEEGTPYPEYDSNDPVNSMNEITAEYYQRKTDRVSFKTHPILNYDIFTHTYHVADRFSEHLEEHIRTTLGNELVNNFDLFMLKEWGPRLDENGKPTMTEEEVAAKIAELDLKVAELHEADVASAAADEELARKAKELYSYEMSAEQIEAEAAEKAEWASGYLTPEIMNDDGSLNVNKVYQGSNDFGLNSFFSADDYDF